MEESKMYATLGWDLYPTTTKGDGKVLPRDAENLLRGEYYPEGIEGEWPKDPKTGKQLEIDPSDEPKAKETIKIKIKWKNIAWIVFGIGMILFLLTL